MTSHSGFTDYVGEPVDIAIKMLLAAVYNREQGEYNDPITRQRVILWLNHVIKPIEDLGLIKTFKVVCDDTNNPVSVIDKKQFGITVYWTRHGMPDPKGFIVASTLEGPGSILNMLREMRLQKEKKDGQEV